MAGSRNPRAERDSVKRRARIAGVLYFALAVVAPIGLMIVPGKLMVSGDAAATADRIRASESLFRIGLASELASQVIVIFLVLALYRLFREVDERLAVLVVILGALVSVPIAFANAVNSLAALVLVGDAGFLSVFDRPERDALAYLFLRLHGLGLDVVAVFWGLWLFPFGLLVVRSGFIPRVLGFLMMVAGAAYLASSATTLVFPQHLPLVARITMPLYFGEVPIVFWLLIWGARGTAAATGRAVGDPGD